MSSSGDQCMEKRHKIKKYIDERIRQFEILGKTGRVFFNFRPFMDIEFKADLLSELLFCISTAGSSAKSGLLFQQLLCSKSDADQKTVPEMLKQAGVRFADTKSKYIVHAIEKFPEIMKTIKTLNSFEAREWLVKHVKGLGYKEASHFLRNTGRKDVAILDRHILRWLVEKNYLDNFPRNLNRKKYMEIEELMKNIGSKMSMSLAELDLLLWHEMTGLILK